MAVVASATKSTGINRACLTGKDVADLLNGECVKAYGVEFVFDGDGFKDISAAFENFRKKAGKDRPAYSPSAATIVQRKPRV